MAAGLYTIIPGVDDTYQFPPEIRNAFLLSGDVQTAIDSRADVKVQARLNPALDVRQYQNYRWLNEAARISQSGMRAYDRGIQLDTGVEYAYVNGIWRVNGGDNSVIAPFIANRQYQNYRWSNQNERNAQTGMRAYDRGVQIDTGVEYQYSGSSWDLYISPATPSTDAAKLISGTLANARLDYGVIQGYRGDRSVDAPVNGDTVNGDWNKVLQPGVYRIIASAANTNAPDGAYLYGTLVLFGAGGSIQSRTQMYFAHTGAAWYRTAWNGGDFQSWRYIAAGPDIDNLRNNLQGQIDNRYTRAEIDGGFSARDGRLNNLEANGTPGFSAAAGWTLNRANFWRAGRVLTADFSLKRTGGSIASGNIANILMGTISGGFGSAGYASISSGPGGIVSSFFIQGTGLYIAATSASIANNSEVTCGGTWIMS